MPPTPLQHLASLLSQKNAIDEQIAAAIGRTAHPGHIGEFVAAAIFDIDLAESATQKAIDGHFTRGQLAGKSVNIKKYSLNQGILDIAPEAPGYYLVLTGPRIPAASSRGTVQPWTIDSVFLFDAPALLAKLAERRVKIGTATSVVRPLWDNAEIYPTPTNPALRLTPEQTAMLRMFQ